MDGWVLSKAYKRPQTKKGGHEWWKYVYDEYYDCIIYRTTTREGYLEHRSDPSKCAECPTRDKCINSKGSVKTVQRHIWKGYKELAEDVRHTPKYRELYEGR